MYNPSEKYEKKAKNVFKNPAMALFCAVIGTFFLCNCSHELPDSYEGTPVFTANGMLNNNTLNIEAGRNGYYLYTQKTLGADSIYSFVGSFKRTNADSSHGILRIELRDYKKRTPNEPIDIEKASEPKMYYFRNSNSATANGSLLKFIAEPMGVPPFSYAWNFGDGQTSTDANTTHRFTYSGNHQVQLVVRDAQNRVQNLSNPIYVPPTYNVCSGNFSHNRTNDRTFDFEAMPTPDMICTNIRWDLGDGNSVVNNQYFTQHTYQKEGVYYVTMTMTLRNPADSTAAPCLVSVSKKVVTASVNAAGLGFNYVSGYAPTNQNLSTIAIYYTDQNGETYSSVMGLQPQWSNFTIEKTEGYRINENGKATQKIKANTNCRLFGDNGYIDFKNAELNFGVAY